MVAALALTYAGDVDEAETVNVPVPPGSGVTQRAEWEYTAGEVASIARRYDDAEQHYRQAVELASSVGSTFVVGIASVGLLTVLRATGSTTDTLNGYRDVLEYWHQAGNWIQVWTTMRNLAAVLAELGDTNSAQALLEAADSDDNAPAVGDSAWPQPVVGPQKLAGSTLVLTRDEAMSLALSAIDDRLRAAAW